MILQKEMLYLETRKNIYNTIIKNPGIHQRELERKTKVANATLRYHIYRLIKNELIFKKNENGYSRYFVANGIDNNDKKMLNLLRQDMPRKILILLICQKGYDSLTKKQIKNIANPKFWRKDDIDNYKIKLDLTTINYHIKKLVDAGIVERIREGRKISYRIVDEDKIIDIIIKYQHTLDDLMVDEILEWFRSKLFEKRLSNVAENYLDRFYEVFPHPYHV